MLKLVEIVKEYKIEQESILALDNVSIEFRRNEFVSILGPSGCGKTTLLNIIGGLDRYTSGDIRIEGVSTKEYDDVDWDTYRNRRVGFVFQSYNLIPHMNILKNVALSLTLAGVGREERNERAMEALKKVGLESQAKKKPNQLSGGQMQRVAIARALVNDPEIILADEPTGALDSESGIQVMDLLKEVAKDRLVIMVTHNPQLADEYSTRIVYLKDGRVVGDTMPYVSDQEEEVIPLTEELGEDDASDAVTGEPISAEQSELPEQPEEEGELSLVADAESEESAKDSNGKKPSAFKKFSERLRKARFADKSAMKLSTAISLSWNNLVSKKGRTALTSIAGSIGIIGIVLVLALSNGASMYINSLEESALSNYPISVAQSQMNVNSIFTTLMSSMNDKDKPVDDTIRVQEVLGKVIPMFFNPDNTTSNDLHSFKQHIDANFDVDLANVQFDYGTTLNCYILDKDNDKRPEDEKIYMKVNPYSEKMGEVIGEVMQQFPDIFDKPLSIMGQDVDLQTLMSSLTSSEMMSSVWSELSSNQKLLDAQYELVGEGSRWPQKENEVVVVVSQNNKLMDFQLFMLGLQSQDEVMNALMQFGENGFAQQHSYDIKDILSLKYKVMTNADYLEKTGEDQWTMHRRDEQSVDYVDEHAVTFADGTQDVSVVGVVRPKAGAVANSISGILGYPASLTTYLIKHAMNNEAVQKMLALYDAAIERGTDHYDSPVEYYANADGTTTNKGYHVALGDPVESIGENTDSHFMLLRMLGYVDLEYPQAIRFYCTSFDSKDKVIAFIEDYNATVDKEKRITYNDSLEQMMGFIDTMVTTLTGVLVAFAAISLIVSTIMIAIIIYTSVLERRKEIGVLRSIGARKKDISRVFIAESAILVGYSGVIGVTVSALLSLLISFILKLLFGISGLVTVTWYHCILMLAISVLLSMLAGFIPSRIAANKDPAIALRTE